MKKQHIIISFIAALLALCAVSCQEELIPITTVTLHAVTQDFNNDSKVYINDHTPYWQNGDRIRINGADYPIYAATENPAPIHNVAICATGYRALFPAGILTNSDADINSSSSVAVTLPAAQVFKKVGPFQRVDVPMGAYFDSGNTLQFHNLCSVVRVYVSNATNAQLPITSISLTAGHAYLSGTGTATIMGDSTDAIVISSANGSHSVSLCNTDNSTIKTVEPLKTVYFDVVIPEFSVRDDLTVTVFTPTGVKSITIEDAVVAHNTITTVTVNVDELSQSSAELVDGEKFRNAIPTNATAIRFEYNKVSVASGTTLSTDSSPYPIYGNMDGTIWVVSTPAKRMNANADCERMFGLWMAPNITSIDFGENFNTANVTNMSSMFYGCYNLTSLNLSNFNTANVRDMDGMFWGCTSLTGLDLSNFNTENVIYMGFMFDSCISLTSLNLSSFNTSNVTNMYKMFYKCSSLTSLNLSSFNTSNVNDMQYMFSKCSSLTSLNLSSFNTSNVTNMSNMFYKCSSLTSLNLSSFNTANVRDMYSMFFSCTSLTGLDLSNFNTENVISMGCMFYSCSSLTSLNLSSFNTSNVRNMSEMFDSCSSLTSLNLSNFNTANVKYMQYMFCNCSRLTSLNLYNFDMSSILTVHGGKDQMCSGLASISGACAITCSTAVQTELQSGTDLVNSRITWYTH